MNIWKIEHTNKTPQGVKIAICLSSSESRGIILQPGQFVLSQEQNTASLDSQKRRGFVNVENFDNSNLNIPLGVINSVAILLKSPSEVATIPVPETIIIPVSEIEEEINPNTTEGVIDKLQEAQKDASDYINKNKE